MLPYQQPYHKVVKFAPLMILLGSDASTARQLLTPTLQSALTAAAHCSSAGRQAPPLTPDPSQSLSNTSQPQAGPTQPVAASNQLLERQDRLSENQPPPALHEGAAEPDAVHTAEQQATAPAQQQAEGAAEQPKQKKKKKDGDEKQEKKMKKRKRKAPDAVANREDQGKYAAASQSEHDGSKEAEHSNQGVEHRSLQQQQQPTYAPKESVVLKSPHVDADPGASALPTRQQHSQADAEGPSMLQPDLAVAEPVAEPVADIDAKEPNALSVGAGTQHLPAALHASHAADGQPKKKQKQVAKQAPAKAPYRDITVGLGSGRPGQQFKACLKVPSL